MIVTWVTFDPTDVAIVEYGRDDLNLVAKGVQDKFIDGGSEKRAIYMYRVVLNGLVPGERYSKYT